MKTKKLIEVLERVEAWPPDVQNELAEFAVELDAGLDQRDAVLDEVLREEVRASMADKRPGAPIDAVFRRARARIAKTAKAARRGA